MPTEIISSGLRWWCGRNELIKYITKSTKIELPFRWNCLADFTQTISNDDDEHLSPSDNPCVGGGCSSHVIVNNKRDEKFVELDGSDIR